MKNLLATIASTALCTFFASGAVPVPMDVHMLPSDAMKHGHCTENGVLNGKRFIVLGNSMLYFCGTVQHGDQGSDDYGLFYRLLAAEGTEDFHVVDCTYSNHHLSDFAATGCRTLTSDCPGIGTDLLGGLALESFDCVIISEAGYDNPDFVDDAMALFSRFTSCNPDVKLVYVNHLYSVYKNHGCVLSGLRILHEEYGVTIVNCGQLIYDIYTGKLKVPGGHANYVDRFTFCNRSGSDTYHPNPLTGCIMSMMLYFALTGECADGAECAELASGCWYASGDVPYKMYYEKYYKIPAALPFPRIMDDADEMNGIMRLIPDYIDKL